MLFIPSACTLIANLFTQYNNLLFAINNLWQTPWTCFSTITLLLFDNFSYFKLKYSTNLTDSSKDIIMNNVTNTANTYITYNVYIVKDNDTIDTIDTICCYWCDCMSVYLLSATIGIVVGILCDIVW